MFGKVLCQVFRWLGPEGEKIEDGEENRFGVGFLPFQDRKFRPLDRKFRWAEVPALGRNFRPSQKMAKSFLGSLSGGVPELLPGSPPRKFPVAQNFG